MIGLLCLPQPNPTYRKQRILPSSCSFYESFYSSLTMCRYSLYNTYIYQSHSIDSAVTAFFRLRFICFSIILRFSFGFAFLVTAVSGVEGFRVGIICG